MSKFSDYLASNITPQMTLLEKMNEILNYLKENEITTLYVHKLTGVFGGQSSNREFIIINDNPNAITDYSKIREECENAVSVKYNVSGVYHNVDYVAYVNTNVISFHYESSTVQFQVLTSDTVSLYQR